MMASYRADRQHRRLGTMITAGLVGGGLLLTASGGVAAETTKVVEEKVRTALLETPAAARVASVLPVATGVAQAAAVPQPPAAPPAPPEPAAPAPAPRSHHDAWFDQAEFQADLSEVMAEANASFDAAMAEMRDMDLQRIAAAEIQSEMPKIQLEIARAQADAARARGEHRLHGLMVRSCGQSKATLFRSDDEAARTVVVKCGELNPAQRAEMRQHVIKSLEQARESLAKSLDDQWARNARENALAAIDRKLEELRAQK